MAAPSPIHRDPDTDGDNYGCIGARARDGNSEIARLVAEAIALVRVRECRSGDEVIGFLRFRLEQLERKYHCGACDTIVKENVVAALQPVMRRAGLEEIDEGDVYGW